MQSDPRKTSFVNQLLIVAVALASAPSGQAQTSLILPPDAFVIERTTIPRGIRPGRELVLWMLTPERHDRGELSENPYTCPEWTLGSYYSGPTRISLVDTGTK